MEFESTIVEFFKKGYLHGQFKKDNNLNSLNNCLFDLGSGTVKKNFSLEKKYHSTLDLRPNAFDYDECFLNILIANNIHNIVDHATQKDMLLGHVQVRTSKPGNSYMPWHRDVYVTDTRDVGMMPPAVKLIYYLPTDICETKLQILEGSHRIALNGIKEDQFVLPGFSNFDNQLFNLCKVFNFENSKTEYIIFDTSCAHSVTNTSVDSARIIYTFSTEYQIKKTFPGGRHIELMEKYRCLKKNA